MSALLLAAAFEFIVTFKTHEAHDQARTCLRSHSIPFNNYPRGPDGNPGVGILDTDLARAQPCLDPGETTEGA